MDQNKLRKLAGLPLLKEWKEVVDAPTNAKPKVKEKDDEDTDKDVKDDALETDKDDKADDKGEKDDDKKDDLPEIITKIALSACKKFGVGDPDGKESDDLTAMEDFLKKVYDAGVADGAAKDTVKEDASGIASVVGVHKAYTQKIAAIKAALEKSHSVNGAPLETSMDGDYVKIHLPNKPYNDVKSVQATLKQFEGSGYEAGNVQ